jgi:diguanylate cyclase (GGDEF)-like protein
MVDQIIQILMVEDNPGDIRLMQVMFEQMAQDFELRVVNNLSSAFKSIAETDVDLILLDLSLPDCMGLETVERICRVAPRLPIVILTGLEDESTALSAVQTGAQDYLIKGQVSNLQLLRALRYAIERKQIELALRRREDILVAVGFAADHFLRASTIEKSMPEYLSRLGSAADVSRIHMFKCTEEGPGEVHASLRYEWVASDTDALVHDPSMQDIPLSASGLERWWEAFMQNQVIHGPLKYFPPLEKRFLAAKKVTSTLIIPIYTENVVWGFIKFDECHGQRVWINSEVEAVKLAAGIIGAAILNQQDEERLEYMATHDSLTDLPNRKLFKDRLEHAIFRAQRSQRLAAVMMLDLDNFKVINDTLGHDQGDELLVAVGKRLTARMRRSDTVARFGGDEFVIILENLSNVSDCSKIAAEVLESLSKTHFLNGQEVIAAASIGVSLYPKDGKDGDALIKAADIALYQAKQTRNAYRYYSQ